MLSTEHRPCSLPDPPTADHSPLCPQDTAGSERYEAMSRIYYRGARAAVVCYGEGSGLVTATVGLGGTLGPGAGPDTSLPDLTNSSSFQRAKFWVNELQNCEEVTLRMSSVLGLFSGWGLVERLGIGSGGSACCPCATVGLPDLLVWHQE